MLTLLSKVLSVALIAIAVLTPRADAFMSPVARFRLERLLNRQVGPDLPEWKVAAIQRVSAKLARFEDLRVTALANIECVEKRTADVEAAAKALEDARDCTYNGLTFSAFDANRDLCATREDFVDCAADGDATCIVNLATAVDACNKIGRVAPDFDAPECPAIMPLKEALETAEAVDCGVEGYSLEDIDNVIAKAKARISELLGDEPTPSNDPRFPDL